MLTSLYALPRCPLLVLYSGGYRMFLLCLHTCLRVAQVDSLFSKDVIQQYSRACARSRRTPPTPSWASSLPCATTPHPNPVRATSSPPSGTRSTASSTQQHRSSTSSSTFSRTSRRKQTCSAHGTRSRSIAAVSSQT